MDLQKREGRYKIMTQKERIEMREIEIMAESRYRASNGGQKWGYYGNVIEYMTPTQEKRYFVLCDIRDQGNRGGAGLGLGRGL